MRHNLANYAVTENLPTCPACGAATVFAHAADFGRDKRVYLVFKCLACDAGETKVWRPEWQALVEVLDVDEN